MNGPGHSFLSADDDDGVVAVFEIGEVEDVVIGRFCGEIFKKEITPVVDGDGQGDSGAEAMGFKRGGIAGLLG